MAYKIVKEGDIYRRFPEIKGSDKEGRALMGYKSSIKPYSRKQIVDFLIWHYHNNGEEVVYDISATDIILEVKEKLQSSLETNLRRAENLPTSLGFKTLEAKIEKLKSQIDSLPQIAEGF